MTKNVQGVLLKKSKLTTNGKPNLPAPGKLVEGELALNYAEGVETISTKNESGDVVTFSSDDYYTTKKLGSGFTGENSAKTVTDVINQNERITAAALNDLNANKFDTSAFTVYSGVVETTYVKKADAAWEKGEDTGSAKIVGNSGVTSGAFAISEGYATSAITQGMPGGAHAEGVNTFASGQGAHAEGSDSKAITNGPGAHAEGSSCVASGQGTHAEGCMTSATTQGMPGVHAEGYMTYAGEGASHAEGQSTSATSVGSHAEGKFTIASGTYSHAEGNATIASGNSSHAEGFNTKVDGNYGHAEGYQTSATSHQAHAEGYQTIASGNSSHAEGYGTKASGENSHAEGNSTSATSQYSHAEGNATIASGNSSHAEGWNTVAGGGYGSHAEGYNTKATADYNSHAEGYGSIATGRYGSHAEGYNTIASEQSSHAEGCATSAVSFYSHSEGYETLAGGQSSHAEGYETVANGGYSHTEGHSTIANNYFEHASGKFNVSSSASITFGDSGNTLFSVGNGTADDARHNAFEIRQNGDIYIVNKDGNDVKLQDEIGNITVDQVLDNTTSASTNPVSSKAVYDAVTDNELVWTNAYVAMSGAVSSHTSNTDIHVTTADKTAWNSKVDDSDLVNFFDDAKYEDSGSTKVINFYHGDTIKATIDADDFIKDGMISGVTLESKSGTTYLVINWNTDAGIETTELNIGDMFEADNYYTKSETSGSTELSTEFALYIKKGDVDQTINSTTSASTGAVSTSAVYGFVTSYTPSITVDQVINSTTSASTNPVATKAVYSAITEHTENTNVHLSAVEKTNLDSLETNIEAISGISSSDVTKWNNSEEVSVSSGITPTDSSIELWVDESVDPITVEVYTKSETNSLLNTKLSVNDFNTYSGTVDTALLGKSDTSHTHVSSGVTAMTSYAKAASGTPITTGDTLNQAIGKLEKQNDEIVDFIEEKELAIAAAITDLDDRTTTVETKILDNDEYIANINRRTRKDFTSSGLTWFINTLKSAIADQNLEKYGLKVGDYVSATHDGKTYNYVIAGLNTMKGTSAPYRLSVDHVGIIVDTNATQAWNVNGNTYQSTNTYSTGGTWTTGASAAGYANCDLHYYLTTTVLPYVEADLGSANIKSHYKLYSTAVNTSGYNRFGSAGGCSSSWAWYVDQKICALSEVQVYGSIVWSSSGYDTGEACRQLDVFRVYNMNEIFEGRYPWLRDVASASDACHVSNGGYANDYPASGTRCVAALILFA